MSISRSLIGSVLIDKVVQDFRSLLEDRDGKCFRTEIRDSGVFICGIHQSKHWNDETSDCPDILELLDFVVQEHSNPQWVEALSIL